MSFLKRNKEAWIKTSLFHGGGNECMQHNKPTIIQYSPCLNCMPKVKPFQSFCVSMTVICTFNTANTPTILILLLAFRKLAFYFQALHCSGTLTTDKIMTLKTKVLFTVDNELRNKKIKDNPVSKYPSHSGSFVHSSSSDVFI